MEPKSIDRKGEELFVGVNYNESNDIAFATLQTSLVELSAMADSKANIMLTVCSILLTLAVGTIEQGILVVPIATFALCCVPALIFSILTVLPSTVSRMKPISSRGKSESFNPLFFMHFTQVSKEQFDQEVDRIVRDPKELYKALSRDIYYAGLVLRVKKYRYLRWSYLALICGVGVGGLALVIDLLVVA